MLKKPCNTSKRFLFMEADAPVVTKLFEVFSGNHQQYLEANIWLIPKIHFLPYMLPLPCSSCDIRFSSLHIGFWTLLLRVALLAINLWDHQFLQTIVDWIRPKRKSPLGTHGWVVRLELQRRYLLPHTLRNQRVQSLALVSSALDDCTCCDNARILSSRLRLSSFIACERCATSWSRVLTIAREIIGELFPQNSTSECVIKKNLARPESDLQKRMNLIFWKKKKKKSTQLHIASERSTTRSVIRSLLGQHEISVLFLLTWEHLCHHSTRVPRKPNSPCYSDISSKSNTPQEKYH